MELPWSMTKQNSLRTLVALVLDYQCIHTYHVRVRLLCSAILSFTAFAQGQAMPGMWLGMHNGDFTLHDVGSKAGP
jgi:hypothetical protein